MLRAKFQENLKSAMQAKDKIGISTTRLILAALKDRDIAARSKGNTDGISDDEILSMLATMVKQRRDSVDLYRKGGREDLAAREEAEIQIIEKFMPRQLSEDEIRDAVGEVIDDIGASGLKDMGRTMKEIRDKYAGQMDFSKASAIVKEKLADGG